MAIAEGTGGRWAPAGFALLGDERLARLAATGHDRAFAVVYERHHQAIYRYCRSILRHDADAQDALQSTFAAAFAALARDQRDAPIRPWLFRIAHNESVSALRRRRPTAELSAASNASSASVEDQVAERAELHALLRDLRKLSERQRSALVMRELSGLSHEEIAIALGTSVGAAKQTIYEARRSLFEFAEGRAMDCDEIRKRISDSDARALRGRRVRTHLRECSACRSFAEAIPVRSADLRALAPAMPMLAAAGALERIAGATAGHAAGGGAAGLAGAALGKTAGAALTANVLAGAAAVASATIGVTVGVGKLVQAENHPRAHHRAAPVSAPASTANGFSRPGQPPGPLAGERGMGGRAGHAAAVGSTSTTVGRRGASAGAGGRTSSRSTARAEGSSTTTAGHGNSPNAPGHSATGPGNSANVPGHSATNPGNSANLPGHSATRPGNSANVPGHSATRPGNSINAHGHSTTRRGNSTNAPSHSTTRRGNSTNAHGRSTPQPGNSAGAPGDHKAGGLTVTAPITAGRPPLSSTVGSPPATTPGTGNAPPQGHSKKSS